MKFKRTVLAVSIAAAVATLSACGGGGGGGGGYVRPTSNPVPYYTPTRVASVTPINSTTVETDSSSMFSQSFSGTGQEVVVAGRSGSANSGTYPTYNLSIFGWSNGTLVDKTSQWFPGGINVITGSEPSVKFADFNGDGKVDMYVAPNTDTNTYGPGVVYLNNGTSFSRVNLDFGNLNGHDSAVYDLNRDGYADIVTMGMRFSFGSAAGTFTNYVVGGAYPGGGASVAVADFMGDNTASLIITDMASNGPTNNRLYSWAFANGQVELTQISVLPTPRFLLPKWASYNFSGSHDIRTLAFDFDQSGRTSAVIFSRPWITNGQWPAYSEVQFLKNQGGGVFVDVTDTTLIGYDNTSPAPYNPKLMDVNGDGLIDIVMSGAAWDNGKGPQVLIHTKEQKYVASYSTVLQAFQNQALDLERAINASAESGANGIVFVQGPDGSMYLATAVSYVSGGLQRKAIYLSKLGSAVTSAQATATSIKQTWPWMSDAQVNAVLAQSSTTWFGLNVLDPAKALQPIGSLTIPGSLNGANLSGSISGFNLRGAASSIKALDSVGRDFNINYGSTSINMPSMFSRFADRIKDDTRSAQLFGNEVYHYNGMKFGGTEDNKSFVLGYTGIPLSKNSQLNFQYTRLPFSPFVTINGAWGLVRSSDTIETTISYYKNGWTSKLGLMYSSTEIYSGLVTRVNPITSVWAESGYEWESLRVYGGMLPKPIAGSANLTLTTGIDNQGRITYTNSQADISSPTVAYARISYTERINKHVTFKLNGMATTQHQQTVMGEFKFNF